jgi:predicted MFS family arabinose efflux permease
MQRSIGMSGLVVSVFSVSYAIGSPIITAFSARLSRLVVVGGGFTVANILSAVSVTLPLLLATRVLAALAAGLAGARRRYRSATEPPFQTFIRKMKS